MQEYLIMDTDNACVLRFFTHQNEILSACLLQLLSKISSYISVSLQSRNWIVIETKWICYSQLCHNLSWSVSTYHKLYLYHIPSNNQGFLSIYYIPGTVLSIIIMQQ